MMYQKKSGKGQRIKALALVPACALALSLTAIPAVKAAITTIGESSVTTDKGSKKSSESKANLLDGIRVVGYGAEVKDSGTAERIAATVKKADEKGRISVNVNPSENRIILDGVEISEEQMNKLDPSEINDITVSKDQDPPVIIINTRKSLGEIVSAPEVLPAYESGLEGLYRELAMTLRYPEEAVKNKITGKTTVEFIILADGRMTGMRILTSSGNESLDTEAMRAVHNLQGRWTPGMTDGKPVNCSFALPVTFALAIPDKSASGEK